MSIQLDEGAVTQRAGKPGPPLYYASAMPEKEAKALLGILHGYADYGARYAHVMGALAEHGIGSVAIDMRGHGRAGGARGYCDSFSQFLDDAHELRLLVDARAKKAPRFLFGHSFGGLVATSSVLEEPASWRGLVLSGPFFGLAMEVPRAKVIAGKVASRVYPKLGLPTGLKGADLTHDPAKARDYDLDPLVFKKATARWFTEAQAAQQRVLASAPRLELPLYVTFGAQDHVASMAAAKKIFDAAGSADKTWDPREGLFHEVLNEPSWKDIVDAIAKWLLAHA
jgi:alpha-beta hydrolase superfamily lysophospholipase